MPFFVSDISYGLTDLSLFKICLGFFIIIIFKFCPDLLLANLTLRFEILISLIYHFTVYNFF